MKLRSQEDTAHLPILLRCYARPPVKERETESGAERPTRGGSRKKAGPSDIVLVFDTETTTDATQRLRVLFYQLRVGGRLDEEGAAYDPAALTPRELSTLRRYCRERGLPEPITADAFRRDVFLARAYGCGAEIVGLNLAFDFARIALDAAPARVTEWRRKMRGAFSFRLSDDPRKPHLQTKHLNAKTAVHEFTAERRQRASRSARRNGDNAPVHRGYFTDVRTLAAAVLSGSYSLARLTKTLGTPTQKLASEEHGGPLTESYLDYARSDVQATWECYEVLKAKYAAYGLLTPHYEILSEASVGKATLATMCIQPWLALNPTPSPALIAKIMCSYFGGRTEVRWRKEIRRVVHTDFTSMYPTVCTLQELWRFIIARGFTSRDATDEVRAFLESITVDQLQDRELWKRLAVLVRVRPDRDLFPVRACYGGEAHPTIGQNYLTSEEPLWFTLADCIAAKLLSGKTPEILEAIAFEPGEPQPGLRPIKLFGRHEIDPYKDDLFAKLIQLRITEKARAKSLSGSERSAIDELCQALKITANSTSYGIFVQVNVDTRDQANRVEVFGPDGDDFEVRSRKVEQPGPNFHPLLATLITGAARLMLALAERRAMDEGLDWVFCDTDSLAIAKPDGMDDAEFESAADRVVAWFTPLNPYGFKDSILKVEDANFSHLDAGKREPLFCFAVSSKRYVLFNLGEDGRPIIRKGSAHGLGHLLAPYGEDNPAEGIPEPVALEPGKDRLELWQHDLWFKIIEAEQAGALHNLRFDHHPALREPAVSRYAATSPELLRWFKSWNSGRSYADQVKPFGFLLAFHPKRARGGRLTAIHPIAPFGRDLRQAVRAVFDRVTGAPIQKSMLKTYEEALDGYQLRPEAKFANADAFDRGRTERRHVTASQFELIGKEADRHEETYFLGLSDDPTIRYGAAQKSTAAAVEEIRAAAQVYGDKAVADATGLARSSVAKLRTGTPIKTVIAPGRIRARLTALAHERERLTSAACARRDALAAAVIEHGGIRPAARALGIDPSNLQKRLSNLQGGFRRADP